MKISGAKLIIFDLDGTLVDAYPAIINSFNFTMNAMGLPLRDDITIRRAVGWGDRNLLKPFVPSKNSEPLFLYTADTMRKHLLGIAVCSRR